MPTDLVASVKSALSSELVSRIASGLGLDRAAVEQAVTAGVPALLAALTSLVERPGGIARLGDAVAQQQPDSLANIVDVIGGSGQKEQIDSGLGALSSLLGGSTLSTLASAVGKYAGLTGGGSKSLMGLLGPLLLGVLGQQQRASGLDASGLASLLVSQKDNIARALPAGFADYLGGTGILDQAAGSTPAYRARPASDHASSERGWILPALAVVVIGALGLYLLSQISTNDVGTSPQATAETPVQTGRADFIVPQGEEADWIGRSVYSDDDKKIGEILELIRDPADRVTDIYVDTGTFLGMGGTRYHFTADQVREARPDGLVLTVKESEIKPQTGDRPVNESAP